MNCGNQDYLKEHSIGEKECREEFQKTLNNIATKIKSVMEEQVQSEKVISQLKESIQEDKNCISRTLEEEKRRCPQDQTPQCGDENAPPARKEPSEVDSITGIQQSWGDLNKDFQSVHNWAIQLANRDRNGYQAIAGTRASLSDYAERLNSAQDAKAPNAKPGENTPSTITGNSDRTLQPTRVSPPPTQNLAGAGPGLPPEGDKRQSFTKPGRESLTAAARAVNPAPNPISESSPLQNSKSGENFKNTRDLPEPKEKRIRKAMERANEESDRNQNFNSVFPSRKNVAAMNSEEMKVRQAVAELKSEFFEKSADKDKNPPEKKKGESELPANNHKAAAAQIGRAHV